MRDRPGLGLGFALAAGLVVRLLGIASRPIWYDEAFAILFAEKGPAAMLRGTLTITGTAAADVHPLGYYTLLWLWMRAFGESLVAVRLLSVLAGLGCILIAYLLARVLFNEQIAIAAAVLVALAPFQVHYSQEIRMYALLCLWLLLATYSYWRARHSGRRGWWLAFAVFAALAQYTHNLAAFYLVAMALWPVMRGDWRTARFVLLYGLVAMLLYLPWLIHLPTQFAKVETSYWVDRPGLYRLVTLLLFYIPGLPLPGFQLPIGLAVALFTVAIAGLQAVRAARLRQPDTDGGVWLLYLAVAPALLLFLFSQWQPVYLERALLPSGAIFCIWLAWALFRTAVPGVVRLATASLLLVAFSMGIRMHLIDAGGIYGPFQDVVHDLAARSQPGDVIVHSNKLSMLPSVYFDRTLPQTYVDDPPGSHVATLAPATQQVLGLIAQPDLETAIRGAQRVWFIIFDKSLQEYEDAGYTTHPQVAWLGSHYTLLESRTWGTLHVYLFSRQP